MTDTQESAVHDTPEKVVKNLKIEIAKSINKILETRKIKQKEAALILKVKQPRISYLKNLKVDNVSLDTLTEYLYLLGYQVKAERTETTRGKPIIFSVVKTQEEN